MGNSCVRVKSLAGGTHLEHCVNAAGVEYSAICKGRFKIWSCERKDEAKMLSDWETSSQFFQ